MEVDGNKASLYVEDFMTEEEEDIKIPKPIAKNKETFQEKKENFNIQRVLKEFVLK